MEHSEYERQKRLKKIITTSIIAIIFIPFAIIIINYFINARARTDELYIIDEQEHEDAFIFADNDDKLTEISVDGKREHYNFYEKLKRQKQVNVLFLGNGAMTAGGSAENSGSWVIDVAYDIENKYSLDLKGGDYSKEDATPFYGYYMLKTYSRGLKYDLVVVCYRNEDNSDDFEIYYDGLLRQIKRQNSKCEIYCVIEATKDGKCENADTIRSLCDFYGGVCIDMNQYFSDKRINVRKALDDDNIPTPEGSAKYYDAIFSVINEGIRTERKVQEKIKVNLQTSKLFDTYEYITVDKMNKVSDKIYEFTTKGTIAGIVYYKSHFGGNIRVYVDGKCVLSENNKFVQNNSRQVRSKVFARDLSDMSKIRIETDTPDNITNILGIIACGMEK